jgi:hypothetical protein
VNLVDQVTPKQNKPNPLLTKRIIVTAVAVLLVALLNIGFIRSQPGFGTKALADQQRLVNVYVDGDKKFVITSATKVSDAIKQANVTLASGDVIEPGLDSDINHPTFNINIHRALPAVVIDKGKKINVLTGHHSPVQIAEAAGVKIYSEDKVEFDRSSNVSADNVTGRNVEIVRAKLVHLNIDDQVTDYRTQLNKVSEFLAEKNINVPAEQTLDPAGDSKITDEMTINIKTKKPEVVNFIGAYLPDDSNRGIYKASGDAWQSLRFCEAGGDYSRNSGNGFYGAYQFNLSTWGGYGGYTYPDQAPPEIQDAKARETQSRRGWNPWPACSRKLGL